MIEPMIKPLSVDQRFMSAGFDHQAVVEYHNPVGGTGAYADSSWAELATDAYGFTFKYDVEG